MDPILMLFGQRPREGWKWMLSPDQGAWSRENALTLANCALLAYSDDADIVAQLTERQFDAVTPCNSDSQSTDTQAYVAVRKDATIIAFRGTEPASVRDFATDFDAQQVPFKTKLQFPGWGRIHEGWRDGVVAVLGKVEEALKAHGDGTQRLWITGHSLGGALAMVTAAFLANTQGHRLGGVYTFGQPRVGDREFQTRYDEALRAITFRCVNDRDLVPHLPPRELTPAELALADPTAGAIAQLAQSLTNRNATPQRYEHAGQLRLLLGDGSMSDRPLDEAAREPPFLAHAPTARTLLLDLPRLLIASPEVLKDHAPINPITHDGYVERLEDLR